MGITAHHPGELFAKHFDKKPNNEQLQQWINIWWRVLVAKNIPPDDPMFEYESEMGRPLILPIMKHQPINLSGKHLLFMFPERHMTTPEEQLFIPLLQTHPQVWAADFTVIDIVTKSPLIVGNFLRWDVRILSRADEEDERGRAIQAAYDAGEQRRKTPRGILAKKTA